LRLLALVLGSLVAVAVAVVWSNAGNGNAVQSPPVVSINTVGPDAGAPDVATPEAPVVVRPAPTDTPSNGSAVGALHGFAYPIAGGCLPQGDQLMPNAPRQYRLGVHEGVDFYGVDNCTPVTAGTPVLAAKAGRVIRADLAYVGLTPTEVQRLAANPTGEEALDKYRGRQVWIDHGGGIVTRYCHLQDIAPGITVGMQVTQGQLIAFVGETGTPESVTNPGQEYHLHFEVRVGASFLGKDLPPAEVRSLYRTLFSP
jgi:murein DD-endopeptidase MepM/ murein hydrolase activator NlpD